MLSRGASCFGNVPTCGEAWDGVFAGLGASEAGVLGAEELGDGSVDDVAGGEGRWKAWSRANRLFRIYEDQKVLLSAAAAESNVPHLHHHQESTL